LIFLSLNCQRDKNPLKPEIDTILRIYISDYIPNWNNPVFPPLNELNLIEEPFLTNVNITNYKWSTHYITFPISVHNKLKNWSNLLLHIFIVFTEGERIYWGKFMVSIKFKCWKEILKLPSSLQAAQIRCALTAVIKKTLDAPETFTKNGWLNIGLYGHQPNLADFYINTGSLYLCTVIFLPLGLPADNPFWINPDAPWTAKKIWNGVDVPADHSFTE